MKKILPGILALLALGSICFAEAGGGRGGEVFQLRGITTFSNEYMLLYGSDHAPSAEAQTAKLALIDESGTRAWEYQDPEGAEQSAYLSAIQVDEQTIAALFSSGSDENAYIDFITPQGRARRSAGIKNARGLYREEGGILVESHPETALTRLALLDEAGNALWTMDLDEALYLHGVIVEGGVHYAYGYRIPDADNRMGAIIAFDGQGNLLGEYDCAEDGEYVDAAALEDEMMLFAAKSRQGDSAGSLACFRGGDLAWKRELPAKSLELNADSHFSTRDLCAMERIQDKVLISVEGYGTNGAGVYGAWLFEMDAQGNVLSEAHDYTDRIGAGEGCFLLQLGESTYSVLYGQPSLESDTAWWGDGYPTSADLTHAICISDVRGCFGETVE